MSLRRLLTHNFWLKLFSLALGAVIWLAIHYSIQHDFTLTEPGPDERYAKDSIRVPVTVVKEPGDKRNFKITPAEVELTVVGEEEALHGPERKNIKMLVDLTDFHARGPSLEDLHPEVPNNVHVINFSPHSVNVEPIVP